MTHVFSPDLSRTADSAILARIAADLASGDDLRGLLQRFLDPIVRLAHAQAGAVRVLSPHSDRLELVSALGLPPEILEAERLVDSHCGFCGQGADEARVVWSGELATCAARTASSFFGAESQGAITVPLSHKGRVLGVYNLFFAHARPPAPEQLALLRSVGELLGLALDKHRLEAENLRATIATERQRMAAEVHDALAQDLTFIKMRLPLLQDAIVNHDEETALALLADVRDTVGDAHGSLREIITHFRTGVDPRGLSRALEALAARFRLRTGLPLALANAAPQLRLAPAAQAELLHVVQEALANVERHAGARQAWLTVERTPRQLELRIEDDGVGPDRAAQAEGASTAAVAHYGIEIMRERARRQGGELSVQPRAGGGTTVRCTLPLPPEDAS